MILNDKHGHAKLAYSKKEREIALSVSLTALASHLGYTPVRQGCHYSLKEMDSLVIYNDLSWYRWSGIESNGISSGSQIDFMLAFGGMNDIPSAIEYLVNFSGVSPETYDRSQIKEVRMARKKQEMVLPEKNINQKRLFAYLIQTRGLSQEVVYDFVKRKLIYESAEHHNIVYCGYDKDGNIRYAGMRGTADLYGKKFKCDVPGNDKSYAVNIVNKDSPEIKVFESVIDCMSYIDMTGDNTSNKIMLGMVDDLPLETFLSDYDHIKRIVFCLDNDEAGKKAVYGNPEVKSENKRKGLYRLYASRGYDVAVEVPESGKDWNEMLLNQKKLKEEQSVKEVEIERKRGR